MKKTMVSLFFITACSAFLFSASIESTTKVQDDWEDRVALSREGGTTRVAARSSSINSMSSVEPAIVEAYTSKEVITISVQNYRGGAWVEIIGGRGAQQSYFDVYDMGFGVVNLSGLRAGEYTIRITLGSEVYSGTFNIKTYGR
jgi:hypothetical protein